jgi:uncharacterized protein
MLCTVFLDTSGLIALTTPRDRRHQQARQVMERLQAGETRFLTHEAVRVELLDTLRSPRVRAQAQALIRSLDRADSAGELETLALDRSLINRAAELFTANPEHRWGFVDCISFTVMRERGIQQAFTTAHQFEQAGFTRLLDGP